MYTNTTQSSNFVNSSDVRSTVVVLSRKPFEYDSINKKNTGFIIHAIVTNIIDNIQCNWIHICNYIIISNSLLNNAGYIPISCANTQWCSIQCHLLRYKYNVVFE